MKRLHASISLVLLCFVAACRADPDREVKPLTASPANVTDISEEVIPLDQVSKSQAAAIGQRVATTEITLTYSRPVARGRQIFGALVPYEQIWTPGADQATAVTFSRNVQINAHPLSKGSYSLWTIPRADMWTFIFNKNAKAYHDHYPGEDQDALRLDARPENGPHVETLTFSFPIVEGKDAVLRVEWGDVRVPLSIRVP
ncbi:MAG TPA: DUF2911 domain-containing protein [Vicinamibacterales bacterium]|jgi:hypothetical protein